MKHTTRMLSTVALAATLLSPLLGMNNADVIKLKQANLSEETILVSIAKEPADYDTSADALIALKKAGLSEAIIQKMVSAQHRGEDMAGSDEATASGFAQETFPLIAPPIIQPVVGQDYFLRSTMHFEGGEYVGTNYARGTVVPINTPVKIESIKGDNIKLKRTDTGESLKIENVEKYTRKSTNELATLLFSSEPTPLEKLPDELAQSIRNGDMRKGMNKEQVLMARGYPPAHETASIDGDRWVFWSSRFVKQTVLFKDGRLAEGRGIY